jgi:hypothetical protein
VHRAWRAREHGDPVRRELDAEPFGEGLHVRLGRRVVGRARDALKRDDGAEQHDRASLLRCESSAEVMAELRDRAAVDGDHRELVVEGGVDEGSGGSESCGGDEEADVERRALLGDRGDAARFGEVCGDHAGLDGVLGGELRGELAKDGLASRDEDDVEPRGRGLRRERAADAVGRAGDDGPRSVASKRSGALVCRS